MEDGHGWMRRQLPLREELLRDDMRPLYLGWLAAAGRGELEENTLEPEVPASLPPAQRALIDFLNIDPDMLAATETASCHAPAVDPDEPATSMPGCRHGRTAIWRRF